MRQSLVKSAKESSRAHAVSSFDRTENARDPLVLSPQI